MWGVAAVATEYAAGPASPATSAAAATAVRDPPRQVVHPDDQGGGGEADDEHGPPQPRVPRRVARQELEDSAAVRAVATPSTPVATSESRCRHRTSAPVPTRAPIAGARATV